MGDLKQQIEATHKQIEKLKAKKKALQTKDRNAKRTQKRKDETRRKILTGAMLENMFKKGHEVIILNAKTEQDDVLISSLKDFHQLMVTNEKDAKFLSINQEEIGMGTAVTQEMMNQRIEVKRKVRSTFEALNLNCSENNNKLT